MCVVRGAAARSGLSVWQRLDRLDLGPELKALE